MTRRNELGKRELFYPNKLSIILFGEFFHIMFCVLNGIQIVVKIPCRWLVLISAAVDAAARWE
jgi:hypothetical protein